VDKADGVPGERLQITDGVLRGDEEQMEVIGQESSGKAGGLGLNEQTRKPRKKKGPILIVQEDVRLFDPPHHDML